MAKTKEVLILWCDEDEVVWTGDSESPDMEAGKDYKYLDDYSLQKIRRGLEKRTEKAWRYRKLMVVTDWNESVVSSINLIKNEETTKKIAKLITDFIFLLIFIAIFIFLVRPAMIWIARFLYCLFSKSPTC